MAGAFNQLALGELEALAVALASFLQRAVRLIGLLDL
jgi:hypothetical protein